jgi:hypothetical protein
MSSREVDGPPSDQGDGDVGPIAPEDGDIVLDTAEITLGTDRSIHGALQRSARAIAAGAPPLRRLARRGVIMPAAVVGLALPTAVLMALVRPGLTGAAIAVAVGASGLAVAAARSARYRAAMVVAADAAFDDRPIAARRALAAADRHWAVLAVWALVDPVVRWSVPLLEHGGIAREPQVTRLVLSCHVDGRWPLLSVLVVPVIVSEDVGVAADAAQRAGRLCAQRWGEGARRRFRLRICTSIGGCLAVALLAGGVTAVATGDTLARLVGLLAAGIVVALSATCPGRQLAARTELAAVLYRYARDGRADAPLDPPILERSVIPVPILTHVLTASGALRPSTQPPGSDPRR